MSTWLYTAVGVSPDLRKIVYFADDDRQRAIWRFSGVVADEENSGAQGLASVMLCVIPVNSFVARLRGRSVQAAAVEKAQQMDLFDLYPRVEISHTIGELPSI